MRLIFILAFFLSGMHLAFAKEFPCTPAAFVVQNNNLILPGVSKKSRVQTYFFQNKSTQGIWIDHPQEKNPGMSAGWASYIRPNNWSALVINKSNFALSCASIQPGKVVYLNCSKVIGVCTPQHIMLTKKVTGNFWLTEDKDWDSFLRALQRRGVLP